MNDKRIKIVSEARKFLGIPFRHNGRSNLGIDCCGLIEKSYQRSGVRESFEYSEYTPLWWRQGIHGELLYQNSIRNGFRELYGNESPMMGDIVLLKTKGPKYPYCHSGIVYDDNGQYFIHAKCGANKKRDMKVVVEKIDERYYRLKLICFLRYTGLEDG